MTEHGWEVALDGVRFRARPVSGEAVKRFQREMREAGALAERQERALVRLLRWAFPLSWAVLWKGDPVRKLLRAPNREELLAGFFGYLTRTLSRRGNRTSGTGSRPQTATP